MLSAETKQAVGLLRSSPKVAKSLCKKFQVSLVRQRNKCLLHSCHRAKTKPNQNNVAKGNQYTIKTHLHRQNSLQQKSYLCRYSLNSQCNDNLPARSKSGNPNHNDPLRNNSHKPTARELTLAGGALAGRRRRDGRGGRRIGGTGRRAGHGGLDGRRRRESLL